MARGDDRQVRKTRAAVMQAFGELVVEERYRDIKIADLIRRADVGRSTFYEHFHDKDDVLRQSMTPLLTAMASAADDGNAERLELVLEHFREHRRVALALLNGESFRDVQAWLGAIIEQRLTAAAAETGRTLVVSARLAGAAAAGSQLGLIGAWLADGAGASAADVALAMRRVSRASIAGMFAE